MTAKPIPCALDPGRRPPKADPAQRDDEPRRRGPNTVLGVSVGVIHLGKAALTQILAAVRVNRAFAPASGLESGCSSGEIIWQGQRVRWRVDHYDPARAPDSTGSTNMSAATRMLTIMLAAER